MNSQYSVLLSDELSHGCKLLLGFHVPSSATARTACTHNPISPAKMTKLLNEMISRSVCLFLGGEKRCPFLKKTLWLDLHLDQTAANIKCRQCCASSQLPALLEKVNHQGGIEQHVFPYAEEKVLLLWKGEAFRAEIEGDKFQGDTEGECLFPFFLSLTKAADLLPCNILGLFCLILTTMCVKLGSLAAKHQI